MATYDLRDRLSIQRYLMLDLIQFWSKTPNLATLQLCIVLFTELLYTVFYSVRGVKAYADKHVLRQLVPVDYGVIAREVTYTRNMICHAYGTKDYKSHIDYCFKHWSEITGLFEYVRSIIITNDPLQQYFDKYSLPPELAKEELLRLYDLYNVETLEELFPHIQKDFLD